MKQIFTNYGSHISHFGESMAKCVMIAPSILSADLGGIDLDNKDFVPRQATPRERERERESNCTNANRFCPSFYLRLYPRCIITPNLLGGYNAA